YEARHNLKYWNGGAVAALGPTATGYFPFSKEKAIRYKWKVSKAELEKEDLGVEELELESAYLSLRTCYGWSPSGPTIAMIEVFFSWQKLGYGIWDGKKMVLSALGLVMLDSLMDDLFRAGF